MNKEYCVEYISEPLPSKQGLKLIGQLSSLIIFSSISEPLPSKQGLKQRPYHAIAKQMTISEPLPSKQGLKHNELI